jgi:Archaea bacterial proteins of unknown function.
MHYIRKEVPFGESEERSKKTLYFIDDPFITFYYRFVAPYRSLLSIGRKNYVKDIARKGFNDVIGHCWERLCQLAVSGNEIFGETWGMASRWWGSVPIYEEGRKTPIGYEDIELDVVAESLDGKTVLVGECKWSQQDYADRLLRELKAKVKKVPVLNDRNVVYVLFLREKPLGEANCWVGLPEEVISRLPE